VPTCNEVETSEVQPVEDEFTRRRMKAIHALAEEASLPAVISDEQVLKVCRLLTHSDHRKCLADALLAAQKRIIIVSPQLSVWALKRTDVVALVSKAVTRGVSVVVITDDHLNRDHDGAPRQSALLACRQLEDAGAVVLIMRGIHNKTLIIDDQAIADGSYNWLSAVSDPNHVHHREERSNLIIGGQTPEHIKQELVRIVSMIPEKKAA